MAVALVTAPNDADVHRSFNSEMIWIHTVSSTENNHHLLLFLVYSVAIRRHNWKRKILLCLSELCTGENERTWRTMWWSPSLSCSGWLVGGINTAVVLFSLSLFVDRRGCLRLIYIYKYNNNNQPELFNFSLYWVVQHSSVSSGFCVCVILLLTITFFWGMLLLLLLLVGIRWCSAVECADDRSVYFM